MSRMRAAAVISPFSEEAMRINGMAMTADLWNAVASSKLTTTLRLIKEELPDLEAYAQATNNAKSEAALRQFYWYARWHWCVGLSITGFVTVGLFQLLVV